MHPRFPHLIAEKAERQKWPYSDSKGDAGEKNLSLPPGKSRFVRGWVRHMNETTLGSSLLPCKFFLLKPGGDGGRQNEDDYDHQKWGRPSFRHGQALDKDRLWAVLTCPVLSGTCSQELLPWGCTSCIFPPACTGLEKHLWWEIAPSPSKNQARKLRSR